MSAVLSSGRIHWRTTVRAVGLALGLLLLAGLAWIIGSAAYNAIRYETVETWCSYQMPKRADGVSAELHWHRWRTEYECVYFGESGAEVGRRPAPHEPPWLRDRSSG